MNDPGTARVVITQLLRVLSQFDAPVAAGVRHDRLWVPPISVADLLQESFLQISLDGAGNHSVQRDVQTALLSLSRFAPAVFAVEATRISQSLLGVSDKEALLPCQHDELHRIADEMQKLLQQHTDLHAIPAPGI